MVYHRFFFTGLGIFGVNPIPDKRLIYQKKEGSPMKFSPLTFRESIGQPVKNSGSPRQPCTMSAR